MRIERQAVRCPATCEALAGERDRPRDPCAHERVTMSQVSSSIIMGLGCGWPGGSRALSVCAAVCSGDGDRDLDTLAIVVHAVREVDAAHILNQQLQH